MDDRIMKLLEQMRGNSLSSLDSGEMPESPNIGPEGRMQLGDEDVQRQLALRELIAKSSKPKRLNLDFTNPQEEGMERPRSDIDRAIDSEPTPSPAERPGDITDEDVSAKFDAIRNMFKRG